jgi:hypothetical protein
MVSKDKCGLEDAALDPSSGCVGVDVVDAPWDEVLAADSETVGDCELNPARRMLVF